MSNWFATIGTAASGLNASRYGLSVVSQNIENADTPGYTRRIANQVSVDGTSTGIWSGRATMGGVKITGVSRADDPVLDARVRSQHATGASADSTATQLSAIEQVFPEPSDSGLADQLGSFWNSWGTLSSANSPGAVTSARNGVLTQANTVANTLNSLSAQLGSVATAAAGDLQNSLSAANDAAGSLATLNSQIAVASASGEDTSGLFDQRDTLLDTISTKVGGVATLNVNGTADVSVGGQSFVAGNAASTLAGDPSGAVTVDGSAVALSSGQAAGEVTAITTTIPGYQAALDKVATSLVSVVNAAQANGYDANGSTGAAMFAGTGAADLTVVMSDGAQIAAANAPGTSDKSNASAISQLGTAADGPDANYVAIIGDVGNASSAAQKQQGLQATVTGNVDDLHAALNGVNYDEETTHMLELQHSFQASSRVLTTLDSMLDTLINHTGLGN